MNYKHDPNHPLTTAYPYFPDEEQVWLQGELANILNGRLSMGPRVAEFEQKFAAYCGAEHGIAFPSCTAALETALSALGAGPGDEVLVPVETFIATAMSVHLAGALPVFTEISTDTLVMDFDDAWSRVTERTRGAIVVHFGGVIAPGFPNFVNQMQASGRFVIEDAAHAHGAILNGERAGSMADAGCFSFYPTKIMTTGEGGMLVTSREDVAHTARSLQNRGVDLDRPEEVYTLPGRNNRFTEIAAAMGLSQLRSLPDFLETRRAIAATYDQLLNDSELFHPITSGSGSVPSYWRYTVTSDLSVDRHKVQEAMKADGISVDWPYDPPLHLQPVFQSMLDTKPGMFPLSEKLMSQHLCLPIHARMRKVDAEYVVDRLLHHTAELVALEIRK
jgi:perosamine synthetase